MNLKVAARTKVDLAAMLPPRNTAGDVRAMLRDALREVGITRAELARRLGVTPSMVSHLLDARNQHDIGVDAAARYAAAMGWRLRFWGSPGPGGTDR